MRNVYLCILVLISGMSQAQNLQNSKWFFGDYATLSFYPTLTNPVIIGGSNMDTWESCASVADASGNLLFYTDGRTVWNKLNQHMPNSVDPFGNGLLNGNISSTQGAIIVQNPGNSNIYYIVTIDGNTGNEKGLYYSIVDMTLDSGKGNVTTRNVVMKDYTVPIGLDINSSYHNESEKLTSTMHYNGVDKWIVTQIKGYVLSYLVTSSGISSTPVSSPAPVTLVTTGTDSPGTGCIKISPDGNRFGICYSHKVYTGSAYGTLALGYFNNRTGQVSFDGPMFSITYSFPYGIEFSEDSQNVYFTAYGTLPYCGLYKATKNGTLITQIASLEHVAALQLGINGKIYLGIFDGDSTLGVINDPNNLTTPDFQNNVVSLGTRQDDGGLPQWVHESPVCPQYLTLISTLYNITAGVTEGREADINITASNEIFTYGTGIYHAGEDVVLANGFHSANGSVFRGYIEPCSGTFVGRPGIDDESKEIQEMPELSLKEVNLFSMSPNPASEIVKIVSSENMQSIVVTSFEGKVVFNKSFKEGVKSFDLYVRDYLKGFYSITVMTSDGEMQTQKLIKE